MADDKLTFLNETEGDEPIVEEPQVEDPAQEEAAAEAEPETVGAEPETGDKAEVPPTSTDEKEKREVSLTALLDEREKRQRAERESQETKQRLEALERQMRQTQEPAKKPDFFDNPDAAVEQRLTTVKLQQSKFMAEREFGADVVAEAYAYFDKHPEESHQLINHPSPFHAAVEHYKKQLLLQEIGSDPDAWRAKQLEELQAQLAQTAPAKPKAPPPSMARTPSAGGEQIASGSAFDQVFS